MKRNYVALGAALVALAAVTSPASAGVSAQVRKACEDAADKVRPALRTPEREQFIANCLADATATKGSNR
jgi:hypothetical protein